MGSVVVEVVAEVEVVVSVEVVDCEEVVVELEVVDCVDVVAEVVSAVVEVDVEDEEGWVLVVVWETVVADVVVVAVVVAAVVVVIVGVEVAVVVLTGLFFTGILAMTTTIVFISIVNPPRIKCFFCEPLVRMKIILFEVWARLSKKIFKRAIVLPFLQP